MNDQHRAGPAGYPGYRDGVITRTEQDGRQAALWEFTYDGFPGVKGARRTFDLCWTENGRMFDVWVSGPVEKVERTRAVFDTARAGFQPG
jgi:hypothetical protein